MMTLTEDQLTALRALGTLQEGTGNPNLTTDRLVLTVHLTEDEYDLDDDDEDSIPYQVSEIVGTAFRTQWQDGYEPQPSGRTRAELDIIPLRPVPAATLEDVLDGAAHIIADGDVLRAGNPGLLTNDPDAPMAIVVSVYPEPGMPNSVELFRLESTEKPDAEVLEVALREKYVSFSAEWDD